MVRFPHSFQQTPDADCSIISQMPCRSWMLLWNDLTQLISHLDLEAMPATPDMTLLWPYRSSVKKDGSPGGYEDDSPIKKQCLSISGIPSGHPHINSMLSVSSLRPYAQSHKNFMPPALPSGPPSTNLQIWQQITPWSVLMEDLLPVKSPANKSASPKMSKTPLSMFCLGYKQMMTPAPEPEPAPVLLPLHPPLHKFSTLKLMDKSNPAIPSHWRQGGRLVWEAHSAQRFHSSSTLQTWIPTCWISSALSC